MATVVVKGESVYQCDVCNRKVRVPTNKQGIDIMHRCIITYGCQGRLHRLTLTKEINSTPALPPEVQGVQDWSQRKVLHTHRQPVAVTTWKVNHDLANKPILHTYVNRYVDGVLTLVPSEPKTTRTIDLNTVELTFDTAQSGLVQCVALSARNATNPNASIAAVSIAAQTQITSDSGEFTIATLNQKPLISVTLSYIQAGRTENVNIEYVGIENSPSIESPWAGTSVVIANGKKYYTRSFNITTTPLAPANFQQGNVISGATFFISAINGVPVNSGDAIVLLGKAPYGSVDRITSQYIEVASIDKVAPQLFYSEGKAFAQTSILKNTYPPILAV